MGDKQIPGDEGETELGVAADHTHGIVRIAFKKPIHWIGLEPAEARGLALMILKAADKLDPPKPNE